MMLDGEAHSRTFSQNVHDPLDLDLTSMSVGGTEQVLRTVDDSQTESKLT